MVVDSFVSCEGTALLREFEGKFDCGFRIDEPGGNTLVFDIGENTCEVPPDERLEDFKAVIQQSLKSGENLLLQRYSNNQIRYEDDVIY